LCPGPSVWMSQDLGERRLQLPGLGAILLRPTGRPILGQAPPEVVGLTHVGQAAGNVVQAMNAGLRRDLGDGAV
jgi:hypothetical protein